MFKTPQIIYIRWSIRGASSRKKKDPCFIIIRRRGAGAVPQSFPRSSTPQFKPSLPQKPCPQRSGFVTPLSSHQPEPRRRLPSISHRPPSASPPPLALCCCSDGAHTHFSRHQNSNHGVSLYQLTTNGAPAWGPPALLSYSCQIWPAEQ